MQIIRYRPFGLLLWSLAAMFMFSSCQDHRDTSAETFGELDSLQVAADTTMQANMDRSYEYQKSLVQNDTTVFDFLAYDKPKGSSSPDWESKFIVIRRTTSAYDTIIKDSRAGTIQRLWLSDLDANGKPEIMFYEYPKHDAKGAQPFTFFAYETDGRASGHKLNVAFRTDALHYRGQDSLFAADGYLIRRSPYYDTQDASTPSADLWQSYRLTGDKITFQKEKKVAR